MDDTSTPTPRFAAMVERRVPLIEALIVLATLAAGFVVLGYLATYFQNYFHLILILFFGWLIAFLISPAADFLERRLTRLPRAGAVLLVIVPVVVLGALIGLRIVSTLAASFADLAASLPGLLQNPPTFLADLQAWFDGRGIAVDVESTFRTLVEGVLGALAGSVGGILQSASSVFGTFIDAIIVLSLAIFMAIDRDKILDFGLELTPPDRRDDQLLFRRSIATAFSGFIRSQIVLGALYGVWALLVCVVFGLPFALALAFLSGAIMAIPIYGPYVSWLPPVFVAVLVDPGSAILIAVVMLVGWFIDENILAPLVRAGALQLHPIVVTVAFLLGAQLAGAIGALIAIPVAAVIQAFFFVYVGRYRAAHGWPPLGSDSGASPPAPPGPPAPSPPTAA